MPLCTLIHINKALVVNVVIICAVVIKYVVELLACLRLSNNRFSIYVAKNVQHKACEDGIPSDVFKLLIGLG